MNNSPTETHSLSFHPTIWAWLCDLAREDYEGNISAAVAGLVAYNQGIKRAKEMRGEKHSHHVTAGIVNKRETLEAMIREIESNEPGFNAMTWLEIQRRNSALPPQPDATQGAN